jgi:hypothetical protein
MVESSSTPERFPPSPQPTSPGDGLTLYPGRVSPQRWTGSNFPPEQSWLSFEALWSKWLPDFQQQGDTAAELQTLKYALKEYASQGRFNPTLALAIMVLESLGNICIKCGDGGDSCGVMQVRGSSKQCENAAHPCPEQAIRKQVQCGLIGCDEATGTNIKNCLGSQGAGKYGEVAEVL